MPTRTSSFVPDWCSPAVGKSPILRREIPRGMSVDVLRATRPRGELKLRAALQQFQVPVTGRIALDLGAGAGGFTRALLVAGAARVYAVDAGFG